MMDPDIALAASARDWPDRFHRFLLDHGGGRIVERVMTPDQATDLDFDVLLIDDVCSFLTPRLVMKLKQAGREVIGVYMPEDGSDAKRRLLECGITDVIETASSPEEFLAKVRVTMAHRVAPLGLEPGTGSSAFRIGVVGPCEGVGVTEVAIALARSLADELETVLVDLDAYWPSIAQRLDLPVHPNIRTALDFALHRSDRLDEAAHLVGGLKVIGGRADGGHGPDISRADALMLLDALESLGQVVVADLGSVAEHSFGLIREFDTTLLVGTATPVGVARLIRVAGALVEVGASHSLLVVVNQTPRGGFWRGEVLSELTNNLPDLPVVTLPHEPAVEQASWNGTTVSKGRYVRAVMEVADIVVRSLR